MADSDTLPSDKSGWFSWKIIPMALITALVIYLLVEYLAGADDLWQSIRGARWELAPVAVGLLVVNLVLAGVRWAYVVRTMGFELGLGRAMGAIFATWPLSVMTPSRASDFLRAVCVRDVLPTMAGSGSVLAEKVVDVQSLCLLALSGCFMAGQWTWAGAAGLVLLGVWTVAGLLCWKHSALFRLPILERFEAKISQLFKSFSAFRRRPARFVWLSLISLGAWLTALALMYSLTVIFGAPVTPAQTLALWPLAIFVGMMPLTVAGMGTRDVAFVTLISSTTTAAVAEAPILAATLAYALVATWVPAVLSLPWMLRRINDLPEPISAVEPAGPRAPPDDDHSPS